MGVTSWTTWPVSMELPAVLFIFFRHGRRHSEEEAVFLRMAKFWRGS